MRGAVELIFDAFVPVFNFIDIHAFHFGTAGMDCSNALTLAALNTGANLLFTDKATLLCSSHSPKKKRKACQS